MQSIWKGGEANKQFSAKEALENAGHLCGNDDVIAGQDWGNAGKQFGSSDDELTISRKQTKREKFLSEMEVVVPWQALIDLIRPPYPTASKNGGRPRYPLARTQA